MTATDIEQPLNRLLGIVLGVSIMMTVSWDCA
jgi:hypothetical protein